MTNNDDIDIKNESSQEISESLDTIKGTENKNSELTEKELLDQVTSDLMKYIKDNPVDILIKQKNATKPKQTKSEKVKTIIQSFQYKPKDIVNHLNDYVIGQEEAKKTLAIAICDHMNMIKNFLKNKGSNFQKQNIMILGPSGVGKTYLIKCISELLGIPFVKSDATKFTETGYQGSDVEDLVRQLLKKDKDLAEFGIIYLDEIDKIAGSNTGTHKDVGGRGVQANLLKLLEDTDVPIRAAWDMQSQMKAMMNGQDTEEENISTKHILFIVSGAFIGLENIIEKRQRGSKFGFDRQYEQSKEIQHSLHDVKTEDLVAYGFETEFIGRLPVKVACNELSRKDLKSILIDSKSSHLKQCIDSLKGYNIQTIVTDCAYDEIADKAFLENTGARGLMSIIESAVREFKYELPSSSCKYLIINKELIKNPQIELTSILSNPQKYQEKFFDTHFDSVSTLLSNIIKHPLKITKTARDFFINQHKYEQIPLQYTHQTCAKNLKKYKQKIQSSQKDFQLLKKHCVWTQKDWDNWGSELE